MPEPLKDLLFNRNSIEAIALELAKTVPNFDHKAFVKQIVKALPELELKARAEFIADILHQRLPDDYPQALGLIRASLPDDKGWGKMSGFEDFRYMPYLTFIEKYGLDHPNESLSALYHLTRYFTAEGAIRPYLLQHYKQTMKSLELWVKDKDWRVRRLVSEGTRPRLPWTPRLPMFVRDPSPVIAFLEILKDDNHEVVRRSVANNLNDIAKDHPDRIAALCAKWAKGAAPEQMKLIRHGLRTLIKQGHPQALKALGFDGKDVDLEYLKLKPKKLIFGEKLSFEAAIINRGKAGRMVLDYAIHFPGAKGEWRRKIFKGSNISIGSRETYKLTRHHAIKPITTRRYYPGLHRLEIIANGLSLGFADFDLVMD